jgi:hypothetical protein
MRIERASFILLAARELIIFLGENQADLTLEDSLLE